MAKKTDEITPPKMNILAQYVRDLSFENILAQKGVDGELNPEIQVNVNIDAQEDPSTGGNPLEMTEEKFQELISNCILGKY